MDGLSAENGPDRERTFLERGIDRPVSIGGKAYRVKDIRPVDIPAVMAFIDGLSSEAGVQGLKDTVKAMGDGGRFKFDYDGMMSLANSQPMAVCRLLAAILDGDPMGDDSPARQEAMAREFMGAPVTELSLAMGIWIEANAAFFAKMASPLVLGLAEVIANMDRQALEDLEKLRTESESSSHGNA